MQRTSRTNRTRLLALGGVATLLITGCGARLTQAQLNALDSTGGGSGAGSSSGLLSGGSTSATTLAGSSATGGTGTSGGTGSTAAVAGSAGTKGTTSRVVTSGGGSSTEVEASNPLAGPGGKVCKAGTPGSGPGVTSSTITVGNIATINGPVPGLFAGARYGAQAVADYINSTGGICGREVKVDSADDQFDQATDQSEASSMSNSVLSFMGSFSLDDSGIPAGAPGVPDIGEALSGSRFGAKTNFSPQPEAPGYDTGAYINLKSQPKYAQATQHMAMLIEDTPETLTTGEEEEQALESAGYKFVFTDQQLQPTDPTFDNDVSKMKADGVEGIVFQATATLIGQLANDMYADGLTVTLGNWCPSAYDPAFISNAGPGDAGTMLSQSFALYQGEDASTVPMVATLDQWYSRVDPGQSPDIYAVYAWESGLMLAEALNEEGSVTRASLTAGLDTLTSFTGDGLQASANPVAKTPPTCYLFITVSNGKFVRAPGDPATGFICSPAGYYHSS